ncbi:MAG TPA: OsmC family protein [Gemmatimonadaceae bacterium]|nr:OsmC family protein [Gemmatimonadaceae bacterium]
MKITLLSDDAIRLEPTAGPLTVEAPSADVQYSPFQMLASGLASCTFSVLYSWATHADLSVDDLAIEVHWSFADDPHRMSDVRLVLDWPSLPANRGAAARRASELCTIHATLTHPPTIGVSIGGGPTAHEHHHAGASA